MNLAANIFNLLMPEGSPGLATGESISKPVGVENGFVDFEGLLLGMVDEQENIIQSPSDKLLMLNPETEIPKGTIPILSNSDNIPEKPGIEIQAITGLIVPKEAIGYQVRSIIYNPVDDTELPDAVKSSILPKAVIPTLDKSNLLGESLMPDTGKALFAGEKITSPQISVKPVDALFTNKGEIVLNTDDIIFNESPDKGIKAQVINRLADNLDVKQVDIMNPAKLKSIAPKSELPIQNNTAKSCIELPRPVNADTGQTHIPDTITPAVVRPVMTKSNHDRSETKANNTKNDISKIDNPDIKVQETELPDAVKPARNADASQRPTNNEIARQPEIILNKVSAEKSDNSSAQVLTQLTVDSSGIENKTHKAEMPAVRFVVPSEIKQGQLKNGRTVVIKMDPEHLGNVRLTLSSQHDGIVGRMVVESQAARTAVEANLDNLAHELARDGLKLDSFQVSVSGGEVGGRQPHNQKPTEHTNITPTDKNSNGLYNTGSAQMGASKAGTYISSAGVNLLA